MNLRQLEYFLAVAERRSILKASQTMHVSQPSVSVQIKALEEELGVQLFERRRDGVVLTPEGEELMLHARGIFKSVDTARSSLQAYQATPTGHAAVGIPGSLASLLTMSLVEQVQQKLPNVHLRVVGGLSGHTRQCILDGGMDFGLVYDETPSPGIDIERLFVEELFLATRDIKTIEPIIIAPGEIPMQALAGLPLVLPGPDYGLRAVIESVAHEENIKLNVRAEIDATEQLNEMVWRTGCYTILSLAALHNEYRGWQLAAVRIVKPTISRTVSSAHASDRPLSRAAREVESILKNIIRSKLVEGWWSPAISEMAVFPKSTNAQ